MFNFEFLKKYFRHFYAVFTVNLHIFMSFFKKLQRMMQTPDTSMIHSTFHIIIILYHILCTSLFSITSQLWLDELNSLDNSTGNFDSDTNESSWEILQQIDNVYCMQILAGVIIDSLIADFHQGFLEERH